MTDALGKLVLERGVTVSLSDSNRRESRETIDSLVMRTETVREIVTRGHATEFQGLFEAASYTQVTAGGYQVWSLVGIPRQPSEIRPTPPRARAVLLSVLIPGAGQLTVKQDRQKGWALLATGVSLATGALVCHTAYSSTHASIRPTNSQAQNDYYQRRANRFNSCQWVLGIGALGAWTFSVIDAAAAPPRYFVRVGQWRVEFAVSAPLAGGSGAPE